MSSNRIVAKEIELEASVSALMQDIYASRDATQLRYHIYSFLLSLQNNKIVSDTLPKHSLETLRSQSLPKLEYMDTQLQEGSVVPKYYKYQPDLPASTQHCIRYLEDAMRVIYGYDDRSPMVEDIDALLRTFKTN